MMMISIPRLGGRSGSVELPEAWADGDQVSPLFDRAAKMICEEWVARRRPDAEAADIAPVPWLERTCYEVLTGFLEADQSEAFDARIRKYQRNSRGQRGNINVFQKGLMAISAHDGDVISARDRERVGKRLWHAYRHYVPPPFLMGFFKQLDAKQLLQRAADDQIEPGFDEWIAQQLSDPDQPAERGKYPQRIVELSERMRRDKRFGSVDDWEVVSIT